MPEIVRLMIASSSRAGVAHEVTFTTDPRGLRWRCSCEWATFNPDGRCRHVDEALELVAAELGVEVPPPATPGRQIAAAPAPPVTPEQGRRARAAARRPPASELEGRAPRESAAKIRARVDLEALRKVEAAQAGGAELGPLEASTLERRAAIILEAERAGVLPPPEQTRLEAADVAEVFDVPVELVDPPRGTPARRRDEPVELAAYRDRLEGHREAARKTRRPRRERLEDDTVREVWPPPMPEPAPTEAEAPVVRAHADAVFDRHGAPKGGAA